MTAATKWTFAIVGILGMSVLAHIVLVVKANSDPSFFIEPDYYAKALAWDDTMAKRRASDALGWRLVSETRPSSTGGVELLAILTDQAGRPIRDAKVSVQARHNARANAPVATGLVLGHDDAYHAVLPVQRSGLWVFEFSAERGSQRFLVEQRQDVVVPPGVAP
jgi:nitrogen fixation protein FixH